MSYQNDEKYLKELIEKYSLPIVILMLSKICFRKAREIEKNLSNLPSHLEFKEIEDNIKVWNKNSEMLEKFSKNIQ